MGNQCCAHDVTRIDAAETSFTDIHEFQACSQQPQITNPQIRKRIETLEPLSFADEAGTQYKPPMRDHKSKLVYHGQWKDNKPHGKGKLYLSNGEIFEGSFSQGIGKGVGRFFFSNGDYYEGAIDHGQANGKGKYVSEELQFTGSWVNSHPQKGIFVIKNGAKIEKNESTHSVINYLDGSVYTGEIQGILPEGKGTLRTYSGNFYEGQWHQGQMHGKGSYMWNDGSHYEGEYVNGKKSGHGKLTLTDGSIYEGEWLEGNQHGKGKNIHNGITEQGHWENGKKV